MFSREEQFLKARSPIDVTLLGITTVSKLPNPVANVSFSIAVNPEGKVMPARFEPVPVKEEESITLFLKVTPVKSRFIELPEVRSTCFMTLFV